MFSMPNPSPLPRPFPFASPTCKSVAKPSKLVLTDAMGVVLGTFGDQVSIVLRGFVILAVRLLLFVRSKLENDLECNTK